MGTLKIPKVQTVFQFGILILCLKTAFSQSQIMPYTDAEDNFFTAVSVMCMVVSILLEGYSIKTLFLYAGITMVSLFSVLQTGNYGFLITVIVCLAIRGKSMDKVLNFVYKYQLCFFVIHTCAALLLSALGKLSLVMTIAGKERYCFGFKHPNLVSLYLFNLLILWAWLNYDKIKRKHICGIFVIAVIVLLFTRTRTSFLTVCVFCALLWISPNKHPIKEILNWVMGAIVPLCAGATLWCVNRFMAGDKLALLVDKLLSTRIKLGAYGVSHFGYSMFGQNISNYHVQWEPAWGLTDFTFDNMYTYLAVNQGFVWIVILSVLFYLLAKRKDPKVNVFAIVWALYGMTEVHGLNGFCCFPIFLIALLFEDRKSISMRGGQGAEAGTGICHYSGI